MLSKPEIFLVVLLEKKYIESALLPSINCTCPNSHLKIVPGYLFIYLEFWPVCIYELSYTDEHLNKRYSCILRGIESLIFYVPWFHLLCNSHQCVENVEFQLKYSHED